MPPVFGPSSPSRRRLKSWAGASARASSPAQRAKSETSSPSSSSSTTTRPPRASAFGSAAATSSSVRQTKTPFPAASPSALMTHGARGSSRSAAVGTPAACMTSFAKDLEPSIWAAAAPGPKTAMPAWRRSSASPATSGASGPTTTRSMPSWWQSPSSASESSGLSGWQVPRAAMPGLPGAACRSPSPVLWAIFHASACSRPPEPTMRTFTRASLIGASAPRPRPRAHGSRGEPYPLEPHRRGH